MAKRIVIIGTSCSGKTTVAEKLADTLQIKHIQLDELHWLPDWQERNNTEFRQLVQEAVQENNWVLDGNYSATRGIVWPRATTIIWLNYPFLLVFYQAAKRSIIRAVTKKTVCAGNTESFRQTFFSKDSMILYVLQTHQKRQKQYPQILANEANENTQIIVCKSRRETELTLSKISKKP